MLWEWLLDEIPFTRCFRCRMMFGYFGFFKGWMMMNLRHSMQIHRVGAICAANLCRTVSGSTIGQLRIRSCLNLGGGVSHSHGNGLLDPCQKHIACRDKFLMTPGEMLGLLLRLPSARTCDPTWFHHPHLFACQDASFRFWQRSLGLWWVPRLRAEHADITCQLYCK